MRISAEEAWTIMQDAFEKYLLLDVRDSSDYAKGHIEGAIQIPLEKLVERVEKEIPYEEMQILVYSNEGISSAIAEDLLEEIGYTNVNNFGGISDWKYGIVR